MDTLKIKRITEVSGLLLYAEIRSVVVRTDLQWVVLSSSLKCGELSVYGTLYLL